MDVRNGRRLPVDLTLNHRERSSLASANGDIKFSGMDQEQVLPDRQRS
jgi:hypothetical protein